ncbi:hypothetical protein EB796_015568 [Bugula neritina]|uniref:Ketimine reductase mu-crystallin n=1 Tax=Bugula neritina TaxID=10212 RepID=A0A7J7JIL4_BUGNE|nr:hypothetical protein EB796_015568 [Bugula neritina]
MADHDSRIVSLSAQQVRDLLCMKDVIRVVESGLANFSKGPDGGVVQPVRSVVKIDKPDGQTGQGFFGVMPAYSADDNILACKIVSFYPGNAKYKKATHMANIMVYDPKYGELKAIMDGEVITAMRTAAASAVATKWLVPKTEEKLVLGILGAGVQARSHYEALKVIYDFSEVRVWSLTMESAMKCADELGGVACLTAEDVVRGADIVVTATFAQTPILKKIWVKPGAHINAVGACRADWSEVDPELMRDSVIYVDSKEAAMKEAGDIIISKADIYAEIGEIVNGSKEVKTDPITVFKSLGLGIEDAVTGKLAYEMYLAKSTKP